MASGFGEPEGLHSHLWSLGRVGEEAGTCLCPSTGLTWASLYGSCIPRMSIPSGEAEAMIS